MTTTARPPRVSRQRQYRPAPRPLVSTEVLIVGYLLALLAVGLLGAWLFSYAR